MPTGTTSLPNPWGADFDRNAGGSATKDAPTPAGCTPLQPPRTKSRPHYARTSNDRIAELST
jgi:hypothetical protein